MGCGASAAVAPEPDNPTAGAAAPEAKGRVRRASVEAVDPDAARAKMAEDGRGAGGGSGKKKGGGRVRRSSVEQVRSWARSPPRVPRLPQSLLAQCAPCRCLQMRINPGHSFEDDEEDEIPDAGVQSSATAGAAHRQQRRRASVEAEQAALMVRFLI